MVLTCSLQYSFLLLRHFIGADTKGIKDLEPHHVRSNDGSATFRCVTLDFHFRICEME